MKRKSRSGMHSISSWMRERKKGKLENDFTVPMRQINEALDLVGSSHARKAESEKQSASDNEADDDTEVAESNSEKVADEESEANDSAASRDS